MREIFKVIIQTSVATVSTSRREMLERFCIGELKQDECSEYMSIDYQDSGKEDFYITLKRRVENHFRKMKVCKSSLRCCLLIYVSCSI